MEKNNNYRRQVQALTFMAVLVGTLVLTYFIFKPYLASVILAAIFAVLFRPLYHWLVKIFRGHETLAALATSVLTLLALAVPLAIFVAIVSEEVVSTYKFISAYDLSGALGKLQIWISDLSGIDTRLVIVDLNDYVRSILSFFVKNILGIFSNVADFLVQVLVFIMTLYYILRDGTKFRAFLARLSPMADEYDQEILNRLVLAIKSVIGGNISIAIIQGVVAIVGFSIFNVPDPVIWGAVVALSSLIPVVGTSLVTIPAVIYLALTGDAGSALGMAIWAGAVVGFVDNLAGPKLIGRGIKINGLLVMLSVFGGLLFFGPLGFLFGPLTLSLLFALLGIYEKEFRGYF